jgi:uncharacterized protein YndB with AHSA1/START domain
MRSYPFDNCKVVKHNSNHLVVKKEVGMSVEREVEVQATPEEVWEAIATEEGRERWLEEERAHEVRVEVVEAPHRLVWWWQDEQQPPTRVELLIVAAPAGARVIVTESMPASFPLSALAASLAGAFV